MRKILLLLCFCFLNTVLFSQTYLVPLTGSSSATTCSGTVYDHAGTSSYSNSANGSLTIYPQTTGSYVSLSFISFSVETCCDYLSIYDGTSTAAPLLGTYTSSPGNVFASNTSGALTLLFHSDGSITYAGFEATISCVTSIPLADLIIQTPALGSNSVAAGNSVSMTYTAKNQGGVYAATSYTGFYLSTDNAWDINDIYLSNQSVVSLTAGATAYKSGTLTIPSSTPLGNYFLLFYADYYNTINEDNDSNNVSAVPVSVVTSQVDLYINYPTVSPTSVSAGGTTGISGYEYNQGNSAVTSNTVGFYLSTDMVWDVSDIFLSSVTSSTITAGSYYYFSQNLIIPSSTPTGNYYILFFADYTNSVSETNENNNVNISSITVTSSSMDLSVVTASANPSTIAYGSNSSVSFVVLNQSYQTASTSVGFFLSTDSTWDASDTYLSYFTLTTINANSFYSTSTTVTIPSSTTPGNYFLLAFVDYTGSISETSETNNVKPVQVTITSPVIDLIIQTPNLSPASTSPGSSVSVYCYIFNQGTTSSSSSNVGYYLSTDNVFDAGDVYLNFSNGTTLSAGTSSYRSSTLTIPSSTLAGNYYILYFADYSGMVSESVETNNVNFLAITISAPVIDLTINGPYNPNSSTAGSSISIYCYIFNNGNSSATSSNVGYYISTDNVFDVGDTYLGYSAGASLTAGSSSYRSASVNIPSSTPSGNYYILYFADYSNNVSESDETNNVNFLPIIIGGGTGYTMPVSGSNSATTCSGVIYDDGGASLNYSNNCNGTFTIYPQTVGNYVGLAFSSFTTQSSYDYLYIYNGTSTSDPLLGSYTGSTIPGTIYASGPAGALTLVFISNASTVYAGFAASITCVSSVPTPDLYIQNSVTLSSNSVVPGTSVSATCYIANQGANSASSSNVGYYLSTDSIWDASDTYLNYSTGATLNAGASAYKSATLTIPSSTTPGNYYILYFADYSNQVVESSETNNVNLAAITVNTPAVDLAIITPTLGASSLTAGASVSATCYIFNYGNSLASSSNVGYYLSADTAWDVSDVYLNYSSGASLNGGTSSYRSTTLTVPSSTPPGNYFIMYFADYSNAVAESIETNNVSYLPVTVSAAFTDLAIINYYLSSSTVAGGGTFTANCYILNQGNTSVSYSNVGFYLSADSLWDVSDVYLNYQTGSTLAANSYSSRARSLVIPGGTANGNYFILYFADYSNQVTENNELNNVVFSPVSIVTSVIDLLIFSPSAFPSTVVAGNSISLSSTIFNNGNSVSTSSNVGYYLSADTVFDVSDTYLNYSSGTTLNAGAGAQKSASALIPSSTPPGNYFILFFADYSYMVVESNESNNVNFYAVSVSAPVIDLFIQTSSLSVSSVVPGGIFSGYSYIYNQGNASATTSNVGYYLSSDTLWDGGDTYLNYSSGGALAANSSSYRSSNLTMPSSTPVGNYFILFYADYSGIVSEALETNNVSYVAISVANPFIDLVIQTTSLTPSTVTPGSSLALTCYIYNQGNSSSSGSNVGYYLSPDTVWDVSDTYLTYSSGTSLASGASSYKSATATIPGNTSPGIYFILYFADYSGNVSESIETNNVSFQSLNVITPNVDLVILTPALTSNNVAAGGVTTASCYINNQGTTTASISSAGFYLSSDTLWGVSDVFMNYQSGSSLTAGSSSYRSASLTIPSSTTPGSYYILYFADYLNAESESVETNNVNFLAITVSTPAIDLIIQSPYSPATAVAGGTASPYCYIYNQGNSIASTSNVGYYLSANTVYDVSDVYLGNSTGASLAAGSSSYRSSTLTIPSSTIPGSYYIIFYADYSNVVSESIETNNTNFASITISSPNIDLIIQTPYSPSTGVAGNSVSVSCYILNQGTTTSSSSNVGYYLSSDATWDAGDTYLNYSSGTTLASGSSSYKSAAVTIPSSTTPGNYYILFYADYSGVVTETNETNNVNYAPITITTPSIDLIIQTPYLSPTSVAAGSSVSASCYIYNQGTVAASYSYTGYYLSADTAWDAGDTYLNSSTGGTLSAGTSGYRSATLTIPSSATPGNYYILYYADYNGYVSETIENNNVNYLAITIVTPSIDLIIQTPYSPSTGVAGNSVSVSCYILNQGTTTSSSSNVGYYLSSDATWDAGDTYLNYSVGTTLASGSSSYKSAAVTIPSSTTPGNYYILFYADYSGVVTETNETNNVNYAPITITTPSIDLIIQTPYLSPTSVAAGSSVSASCYIYNQGTVAASYSYAGYYLSADTAWDAGDTYLNSSTGGTLSAGTSGYRSATLTIPSSATPGNYYILYFADYNGYVSETNENNNVNYLAITIVTPSIDLIIQTPYAPPSSSPGASISASCYIFNQGTTASPSSNVGFYLSTDTVFDAGDTYLNYSFNGTLASGSSSYESATLTIPSSTPYGNFYILFFADYDNQASETIETNNVSYSPIILAVSFIDLVIQTPYSPSTAIAGSSISVSCYIYNQGNAASSYSNVGFYLSSDTLWDASDTYLNYSSGTALSAGSSSYRSALLTIPSATPAGNYYVLFFADYAYQVTESIETNNVSYLPVSIVPSGADLLVISPSLSPSSVLAGNTVFVSDYIYNQGNANSSSSNVGYFLSTDSVWGTNDIYLNYSSGSSLAFGTSSYRSATLTIPSTTTTGNYFILYFADYSLLVSESVETNNVIYMDLSVTGLFISVPASGANSITACSDTVFDNGGPSSNYLNGSDGILTIYPITAGDKVSLDFFGFSMENGWDFLYVYDGIDTSALLLGTYTGSAGPGVVFASGSNSAGALTLRLTSDASINNAGFSAAISCFTSNSYPDLSFLSNPSVTPSTVAPGNQVSVSCFITNLGYAPALASSVGFYLSSDTIYDGADTYLSNYSASSLSSGASNNITANLSIPGTTPQGNLFILFYADNASVISESNENNNVFYAPLTVDSNWIGAENFQVSESRLQIFPNPNDGRFRLFVQIDGSGYQNAELKISDLLGKEVFQSAIKNGKKGSQQFQFTIDLGNSGAGVYLVQLISEDSIVFKKVVVE